ncbi:type 4a pilus biogenesis protein PilO [Vibrio sp. TRT 17S01]|uniref:type 4a pilus biogenesis protein PilO n=1 Tax=Vibrio sp. TRT 17S01 TaxID=3418505 RepID=UPI003CF8E8F2
MKQQWQQLSDKFASLSGREKGLISICGFVAIFIGLAVLLVEPSLKTNNELKKQIAVTQVNNQRLEGEILTVTAKLKKDPDQEINMEYSQLLTESQNLSQQLAKIIENLISPSEMAQLLEEVLTESKELHLVSLESLPAEPITSDSEGKDYTGYYLHPVRVELTGSYFNILAYLEALESLPVKYYWRSFTYKVESYPSARLVMEVYTLGTRQEFIGG